MYYAKYPRPVLPLSSFRSCPISDYGRQLILSYLPRSMCPLVCIPFHCHQSKAKPASPAMQPAVEIASLLTSGGNEEPHCQAIYGPEASTPGGDHENETREPSTHLLDAGVTQDSHSTPEASPSESSHELVMAQESDGTELNVADDHAHAQEKEQSGPEVALAGFLNKQMAFEWSCHIVALSATLYLASLSFANYYWVDENQWTSSWYFAHLSQDDALKALQFAAKAHELFIVMSLVAMVLHLVRRRLTKSNGLSVGHLVSGYQVESLNLLFRRRLWSPALARPIQSPGAVVVTAIRFVSILLAKLVGPASAILVLPSLRWWPVEHPFTTPGLWVNCNCTYNDMYPIDLSSEEVLSVWNASSCMSTDTTEGCPDSGWDELNEWSGSNARKWGTDKHTPDNLTMDVRGQYRRILSSNFEVRNSSTDKWGQTVNTSVAVTLQNSAAVWYALLWAYMRPVNVLQPSLLGLKIERPYLKSRKDPNSIVVQVQCTSKPSDTLSKNQSIRSDRLGFTQPISVSTRNASDLDTASLVNLTWIEMGDTIRRNKSIGVLVTLPYAVFTSTQKFNGFLRQDTMICLCAVDARWAPVNIGWDASRTNIIQSNATSFDLSDTGLKWDYNFGDIGKEFSKPIRIGVDWAKMLNQKSRTAIAFSGQTVNSSSIGALFWRHLYHVPSSRFNDGVPIWSPTNIPDGDDEHSRQGYQSLAASILSLTFADGLSRAADRVLCDMDDHMWPGNYSMTVDVSRYGWGYGLSSLTIFAICVLLTHAAMVLAYAGFSIYLGVRGEPVAYQMLADVGELVVMSLASRPTPLLRGDGKASPWNTAVGVREKDEDRLELVAREDVGDLPQAGKAYQRVNSGDIWATPGNFRWLHRKKVQ